MKWMESWTNLQLNQLKNVEFYLIKPSDGTSNVLELDSIYKFYSASNRNSAMATSDFDFTWIRLCYKLAEERVIRRRAVARRLCGRDDSIIHLINYSWGAKSTEKSIETKMSFFEFYVELIWVFKRANKEKGTKTISSHFKMKVVNLLVSKLLAEPTLCESQW